MKPRPGTWNRRMSVLRPQPLLISCVLVLGFVMVWSAVSTDPILHHLSSGAPASSTGAPGEQHCGAAGCHDDGTINTGPASVSIEGFSSDLSYRAGDSIVLAMTIQDTLRHCFGFQLVVLDSAGRNCGSLAIHEPSRTQFIRNLNELKDREYLTYTFEGTKEVAPGLGSWVYSWKAPQSAVGPIHVYAAAVAADGDGSDRGDHVYTTSVVLQPRLSSAVDIEPAHDTGFRLSSTFVHNMLLVNTPGSVDGGGTLALYTLDGTLVHRQTLLLSPTQGVDCTYLAHGAYLIVYSHDGRVSTQRFIKD